MLVGRCWFSNFGPTACYQPNNVSFELIQENSNGQPVMSYDAVYRYARISATKVRPLTKLIHGKRADEALSILKYQPQRGARLLEKVLKSALGNAEDRRAPNPSALVVVDARADGGPMFKRIRPRARGMAHVIKKRFAHIRISLDTAP